MSPPRGSQSFIGVGVEHTEGGDGLQEGESCSGEALPRHTCLVATRSIYVGSWGSSVWVLPQGSEAQALLAEVSSPCPDLSLAQESSVESGLAGAREVSP